MSEKRNIIGAFIEDKLVPVSTGFAQNPYVRCIGSGSQSLMAIIMLGAIFNLFNNIAWDPYQSLITNLGISGFLSTVYNASMNFMGIFMVFSIAFQGAKIHVQFQGDREMALFHDYGDYSCVVDVVIAGLKIIDAVKGYQVSVGVGQSIGRLFAAKIRARGEKDNRYPFFNAP